MNLFSTASVLSRRRLLFPSFLRTHLEPPRQAASRAFSARLSFDSPLESCLGGGRSRTFSTVAPPTSVPDVKNAPSSITPEVALAVQDATKLFVQHGLGKRKLDEIAADKKEGPGTLVARWQRMMEAFLGTQCHVLAGLGYTPDERGISLYNTQLNDAIRLASPEMQEKLRLAGRDTWRLVLHLAFDLNNDDKDGGVEELSIVDARNIMHKVSMKMQEPNILEKVAKKCAGSIAMSENNPEAQRMDVVHKHTVVQDVLVNDVYLGGDPSLVSECGFGEGEDGYVKLQCALAEHQADPLVQQYVGAAMMRMLQSAGLDMDAMRQAATGGR